MMSSIQQVFQRIGQLFDALGYVLMIAASLMMWWGIYSGVGVVMPDDSALQQVLNESEIHENNFRYLSGETVPGNQPVSPESESQFVWTMISGI